jgi:hypothetical protein
VHVWKYIVKGIAMGTQNAGAGHHGDASVGIGPGNDGSDESQRETGGSGGSQLTRGLDDTHSGARSAPVDAAGDAPEEPPEGEGSASTAATRGAQDTHSRQAGGTATGLGAPETGANQAPGDLAPKK